MQLIRLLLGAAVFGSLVACGDGGASPGTPGPGDVDRPTGAGELVIRVDRVGGLQPPLERERQLPGISIYGDGEVLVPSAVPAIFPGPAGYGLERFRVDAQLLDEIVAAAASLGLHGEDRQLPQEGPEFVADAGATVITVVTDGARHVTTADALGDAPDSDSPQRAELAEFVNRLFALRPQTDAATPYEPDAYRVYVAAPDPGFGADLGEVAPVAWPFADPLADWGEPLPADGLSTDVRCRVLTAAELQDALPMLRAASATTLVMDDAGEEAIIAYRPLLPDEEGCGGA